MSVGVDWKELPALTSERLVLRMLRVDDAGMVYAVFRDPDVMRYWSSPPMKGAAEARELIRHIQDSFDSRTLFQWGIASRSTDEILGTCTLFRLDLNHRRCEIGFAIGKQHWGQGIASEAVVRLIRFAFEELDLQRIEADVDPRNERSLRLLERHGFRREGLLRERYRVGGEIQDTVFLGLLRREWKRGEAG